MNKKTLVIIPCLNEGKNIQTVLRQVKVALPHTKVLVIDDGSTDKTREFARKSGATIISHPFNLGYGSALQTGYKYALENNFEYVVQMDGDKQHDPRYLPRLLNAVRQRECDLALGSRFLGKYHYPVPSLRRLGIYLFKKIIFFLTRQKITDPTSGFQAMNKKVIGFYASDIFPYDFPDTDVLLMALKSGFKIKEIPVKMFYKSDSRLHSGLKPLYYVFKMFLSIFMTTIRRR